MANPVRDFDDRPETGPRVIDPLNPVPPLTSDPAARDPRLQPANDPRIDNRTTVDARRGGNGMLIAALVVVLAVIAYFIFAPGTPETTPTDPAVTTEPTTPAPDAAAPAAPADSATPAPDATAPAAPADNAAPAPDATAPAAPADNATPAPDATAPTETAPATPAPAPAPAQ